MMTQSTQAWEPRDQVFISYSHKDVEWLEKFKPHLKTIERAHCLEIWSDQDIGAGENWKQKIDAAIGRARVALLLASADFFASDFICNEELPKILERHHAEGLFLYWVPIKYAAYEKSPLGAIQAAPPSNLKQPLRTLPEAEQDRIIYEITLNIGEKLGQSVRVARDARQQLIEKVKQLLHNHRMGNFEEIGSGDTSVVLRCRRGLRDCAVKVLVNGGVSAQERENLRILLAKAASLRDPAFIKVEDALLDDEPICIVGEYVDGRTLTHVLHQSGPLPPSDVILYVRQLAQALDEAHRHDLWHRRLTPSNVFLEGWRVRLSPVVFLTETARASQEQGAFFTTKEALNYIAPEQYYGHPPDNTTDQYALGLIALAMLQGGPPVAIKHLADLTELAAFFEEPRKFFDKAWCDRAPGLARVIARMLAKDPKNRWESMAAILNAVEPLQGSQRGQEIHAKDAKDSYCRYCRGKPAFYKVFYATFFRRAPAMEGLFAKVSMDRQYEMVDEAIEKLLNFRAGPEPTTLSRTREAHRRFRLSAADFDHFSEAFIETLKAMGENDPKVLDSWYAILGPGLDYMKQVCKPESPSRSAQARKAPTKAAVSPKPRRSLPRAAAGSANAL